MNIGKHIHMALVILLYIHQTQSIKSIHERMLNSKHSPAPTQLFENTASPQIEMLAMDQAQFEPAAADEDIQTTSTSSSTSTSTQMPNGYCSTHYGSNSNNIDTSSDEYHQYFQDAFPHNTSSTTSAPTPSPTQMDKIYKYSIELTNISQSPVISWINKTSEYQQVFNPSWIQSPDDNPSMQPGILAQVQNCTLKPGECKSCNKTSGLVFTTCNAEKNTCNPLGAPSGKVPYTSQIPGSEEKDLKGNPVFKNPSIFYWRNLFYMFVNEVTSSESQHGTNPMNETQQNIVRIFTNENPTKNSSNWTRQDGAFSKKTVTAPAALLSMNNLTNLKGSGTVYDDGIHWLFYGGEGHISVTNSCSPVHWDNIDDTPWLQPRADHFDKDGVETGPAPAKMFDGNYLMLYNGYTITSRPPSSDQKGQPPSPQINGMVVPHQIKHYEVGWVILDGKDPKHILQRSDKPLITSTYPYENGDSPYTCAQRGSVYAKAIVPLDGSSNDTHQTFRVYFSAADTSVGSAVISISYAGMNNKQETEWMTIAIVVSIACGVFVIVMFLVIWCKNKEDTNIVDLTTDPEYISIASAKFSKEISGTNHNGTSYVIGSLDSNDKRRLMGGINDGSRIERQSVYSSRNSHRGNFHKHRRHHHDHRENKRSSRRDNQKKSRRQSVRKYETNEMNPNHIHIHTTDCYDEEDILEIVSI
eukprot:CAMPEP_0201587506 /NCGR_PEP_ID=MMETSP0190_2-20130828/144484_1 /ASSEMBLY_ACC=CAM_ASM_000263 /TAXON_ID=37353 /ORGANISM="Rosalina sp." /LENGTH=696 /DNA_ID=CAMNT_0048037679 /DNA_START=60 /DNA_END=2151 /DNA_ORIENTATION=-